MINLGRLFSSSKPSPIGDRFGYAVVGLGRIADYFLDALADSPIAAVTALVSGDAKKAASTAKRHEVPYTCSYADYESLRDRADVHAVYLALPVSLHREYTLRAAAIGKHVLVEKPMASNSAECREMIEACRAAGVLLSVAYRCPHDPLHQRLRELVRTGALGRVERIESQFGFALSKDDWRFNAGLAGGGSLFDVGIYPLNAARFLLGEEPAEHTAIATLSGNGMETSITWTSTFPSGAVAACRSSYLDKQSDTLTVHGTRGSIRLAPAFSHRERFRMQGEFRDASGKTVAVDESTPKSTPSHFRLEAENLAESVRKGTPLLTPGEDGLHDLLAMEAIYAAAGVPPVS